MKNALSWFEIPSTDIERAVAFYEAVTGARLKREIFFGAPHAVFQVDGVGGAIIQDEASSPSKAGALVYLDARGELDAWLARVPNAGGSVLLPRTEIGNLGAIAIIVDTEGNRVGFHTPEAATAPA